MQKHNQWFPKASGEEETDCKVTQRVFLWGVGDVNNLYLDRYRSASVKMHSIQLHILFFFAF